jgi:multidrug resistance efflux pump
VAARDRTERPDIRVPQDGMIHDLSVHSACAVIAPGATIMTIVPDEDALRVENPY